MQQIWDNPCYILRVHRLELPRNDVFLSLEFFRQPQNSNAAFHLGPLCLWISSLQKNPNEVFFFVHIKHKNADILIMTSE